MIVAGIDEAGYGPLLGPLVVSATAFELEGLPLPVDGKEIPCLWRLLRGAVAKKAPVKKGRILVADSKVVHNLADGDKLLERGVLAFLRTLVGEEAWAAGLTAGRLIEALGCTDQDHELGAHPWYAPGELGVPWLAEAGDLGIATNMLTGAMGAAKVRTVCMRTAVVSEKAFNRLVGGTQNKASALVSITLSHLYHLHTKFGHLGLVVGVDKQGGRDHYTQLLLEAFPEAQLKVLMESAKGSSYLLTERGAGPAGGGRQTLIYFREKGETLFMPTALASMLCKYLRELCMHSFNSWWCRQIEGLRPTAGYYGDGTRWLTDVEPHLGRLGIRKEMLVRVR